MTAILQPLKNGEDNTLSICAQTILIFGYGCCVTIRILNADTLTTEEKAELMGFSGAWGVFLALGFCFIAFLVLLAGSYMYKLHQIYTIRMNNVGDEGATGSTWIFAGASI